VVAHRQLSTRVPAVRPVRLVLSTDKAEWPRSLENLANQLQDARQLGPFRQVPGARCPARGHQRDERIELRRLRAENKELQARAGEFAQRQPPILPRRRPGERFRFVSEFAPTTGQAVVPVLKVSRSGYYTSVRRPPRRTVSAMAS